MSNRRKFIKESAWIGAGLYAGGSLLSLQSCKNKNRQEDMMEETFRHKPFGIQLWSVKEEMHEDPKGTLKQLASFGYTQIESFEGEMGMFWGMKPKEFSTFLKDEGMTLISSHCNVYEDFERKAAQAAEAEMQFLICPWIGPSDELDFYKKTAAFFNECGGICYDEGIYFGYHNHDYSFRKVEGEYPQDILIQYSTSDIIFELDVYWAIAAGHDPIKWLQKYTPKWHLAHIKDREDLPLDVSDASTILGTGTIDYTEIFERQDEFVLGYLIVEQERFINTTPMQAAKENARFMKEKLRIITDL